MFNRSQFVILKQFNKIQKIFKLNKKEYKKIEIKCKKMNVLSVGKNINPSS